MDTLRDRLEDLADEAPTGGAPAAELWARGRRGHRRRAAALAATLLVVVGTVGTVVGVRLVNGDGEGDGDRSSLASAGELGFTLPIEYPVGKDLPDLGDSPGPLAAVWLAPREPYTLDDDDAGRAPEAVGLVAATGTFGTLPIELSPMMYEAPDARFALSPDGRRIAYYVPTAVPGSGGDETRAELVYRDLVSGDEYSPAFEFEVRGGATWVDATHLVGHVAGGTSADGWIWEPGTTPKLVDSYPYLEGAEDYPPVRIIGGDPPWSCRSPTISDRPDRSDASVLCDVVGFIGPGILLGHRTPDAPSAPDDLNRPVVALNIGDGADFPFEDPALRRVVVSSGAPHPVAFATDLIAAALAAGGGAS